MPEFKETVEEIRAEEASISKLFGGDGRRVKDRRRSSKYMENLVEAAKFLNQVVEGRRPMYHLQEAMTTSDFPLLFADILDRQLLGAYREISPVWQNYIRRGTTPDFRLVKRLAVDGSEGQLPEVGEREEYPESALSENEDTYKVRKYGRRLDLSWEALINDDLDAFRRNPERLARGARRTEQRFATGMYVDENGPRADLYTAPNNNIVPGNPTFTLAGLQAAIEHLSTFSDQDGEPIDLSVLHLVTGPGLEVTVQNVLHATEVRINTADGLMVTNNWVSGKLTHHIDPYIPRVATGPEGSASWYLFADPNSGRAFAEMGFLRGHEDPALYERTPDARLVGGGGEAMESFDDDSVAWRIRHVLGGGLLLNTGGAKATVASDGSGS